MTMPEPITDNLVATSTQHPPQDLKSDLGESQSLTAAAADSISATQHLGPKRSSFSIQNEFIKFSISAIILAIGVGVMYSLHLLKPLPPEQAPDELSTMVQTTSATPYLGELDKVISGTVVPFREINVAAEVSGNVISKSELFEAGNYVKKGTLLLEIDPADYEIQLATGNAEVAQSQKMLEETEQEIAGAKLFIEDTQEELNIAEADWNRNQGIRGALSKSELDQVKRVFLAAKSALTTRKNTLNTLEARLGRMNAAIELAKSQLERTKLNLVKTKIYAPDDGVIVREMVQKGDYVRAGDPLVTFEDTSQSEVICNLTPTDVAWIRNNSPASNEFASEQEKTAYAAYYLPKTNVSIFETNEPNVIWDGVLERFDGIGRDQATHSIPCRITIQHPVVDTELGPRALVRGMFVKCQMKVQLSNDNPKQRFISFPAIALRPGNFVWTVKDQKLRKLPVQVVDYAEQLDDETNVKIVIVSVKSDSIQAGDAIVTSPLSKPYQGQEIILQSAVKSAIVDASPNTES